MVWVLILRTTPLLTRSNMAAGELSLRDLNFEVESLSVIAHIADMGIIIDAVIIIAFMVSVIDAVVKRANRKHAIRFSITPRPPANLK